MRALKSMKQLNQLRSTCQSTFLCPSCWGISNLTICSGLVDPFLSYFNAPNIKANAKVEQHLLEG